ncbi:hypothetical protein L7F22_018602 [Adiantum nelumboides]|nr:hypothetical protein [Adiantum nelumboides]
MESFCRPVHGGVWDTKLESGFGAYTPCFVEGMITGISHCTLLCLASYRSWLILKGHDIRRFQLKQRHVHYFMIVLSAALAVWPIFQIFLGISTLNLDGEKTLARFEVLSLLLGSFTWLSLLHMLLVETRVYIRNFRWYTRFGIIYVLVAQTTVYRFIFSLRPFYNRVVFEICTAHFACQVVFGVVFVLHLPTLTPHPTYLLLNNDDIELSMDYEALPGKEQICPECRVGLLSRLFFTWMTPLMKHGFERPVVEADIWQLDKWDQTEKLYKIFEKCWERECATNKPSLLRALHRSLGARFWLAAIFKIGSDASEFVGPVMLNLLLQSMQRGEPGYIGYFYAASIFFGVMGGVLCDGQYYQNVLRVGFRTRATLVAAIFRKSLRITQEGRKGFTSGKILNLMTSDAESLQQICSQLHGLWSAPIRIVVCVYLLHKQIGKSSLAGASVLLLLFPLQTFMINRMRRFTRDGLQHADKRISLMTEILAAMDIVKCYAWESSFKVKILDIRRDELGRFKSAMTYNSINTFLLNSIPVLVTVIAFGMYTLSGGDLTPAKAFTSLSLFAVLRLPLNMLPNLITQIANAKVSMQRLQSFLLADDRVLQPNPPPSDFHPAILVQNGNFVWDKKAEHITLRNVSMQIASGSLVAIVGGTGEGKSSLVSAILGEMSAVGNSEVVLRGKVAYVSQVSWIFNGTVRKNILFGLEYDPVRYKRAIHVSSLEHDFELLPGGDLAEIGERGVNISGGQKQRISIARAVYADADVYIFDDPLSALDAHVACQVFDLCIQEELAKKTRVLVTNQLHFLSRVDNIFLLHRGEIKEQGIYAELLGTGRLFKQLMENSGKMEGPKRDSHVPHSRTLGFQDLKSYKESEEKKTELYSSQLQKTREGKSTLIRSEERETGIVSWSVLNRYQEALGGGLVVCVFFVCYVMVEAARASSSIWLSLWTGPPPGKVYGAFVYTGVFALFSLLQIFTILSNSLWIISRSFLAAKRLHNNMLSAILRAPMSFFNSNPIGRVINRFAKDTADIDRSLASSANLFLGSMFQLCSTFVMIGVVSTASLWAILPLLIMFHAIYLYYQSTAREVKRLDSISRSPVYAQFAEALNGLVTIRAYKAHDRMAKANGNTMDNSLRFTLVNVSSNRWLGIRLECLGGLMIWIIATFAVLANQRANQVTFAAQMGLLLSYALNITNLMTKTLRQASVGENSFNAVERVGKYIDIPPEAPLTVESNRAPPGWPATGHIEFKNVVMRYRDDLPPVLIGLSAKIQPNEKVGIVGRTGAGKSSMFNTLFRIVEPESGQILIDACDISKLGLYDLRRSLSIIPQMPVLFSGTIRFNLDPFEEHCDSDLWEALGRAHLKDVVKKYPLGLDTKVAENGENFSVGQRQLISLARALIRRSKVLVLDEATASVDVQTDALIQKTIREEFKSCTMLIIAHRLNTVIDCDRIMVLDAGQVKELDTPEKLLFNECSLFSKMVESTGPANADYLKNIAMGKSKLRVDFDKQAEEKWTSTTAKYQRTPGQRNVAMASMSSQQDLLEFAARGMAGGILERASDAARIIQEVLEGQHDNEIEDELSQQEISTGGWWSALLRAVQAFRTERGHYEFVVIAFGITGALGSFNKIMPYAFAVLIEKCLFIFLDDILVFLAEKGLGQVGQLGSATGRDLCGAHD